MRTKKSSLRQHLIALVMIYSIVIATIVLPISSYAQIQPNDKGFGNKSKDLQINKLPAKEKRFALIIGVDTYQKDITPLYGTVNDAKALRDVLIKYAGFADERIVLMTTDSTDADLRPTYGNIIDQLDKLQRVVPEDGLILFSFSGHGVSIGNDAFIVPSDGRIYQNADLMRKRSIDVLEIKRAIQNTKVKQVIMFLDACRNDPVKGKGDIDNNLTTAYKQGFSFETKNQNIEAYATLYATSFGDRAYEFLDKKNNKYRGYFSYAIEEGLKGAAANEKGEVTLAGLIKYIEDTVKERVRIDLDKKQIPYLTTEGFRNSNLVIAVRNKNEPDTKIPKQSETPVHNSAPALTQKIKVDSNLFTFELQRCVRNINLVICEFTVTNNDVERQLEIGAKNYYANSRMFDDGNNERQADWIDFSNRGRKPSDKVTLITGIPAKLLIGFNNVDEKVKKLTLIQLKGGIKLALAKYTNPLYDAKFRATEGITVMDKSEPNTKASEQSETPIDNSKSVPTKNVKVNSNLFTFELQKCVRNSTSVICEFTVTNNDKERQLEIGTDDSSANSRMFDDGNNEDKASWIDFANRGRKPSDRVTFVTGIPVKLLIGFNNVDEKVKKLTLIQLKGGINLALAEYTDPLYDAKFREIVLTN